MCIAVGDTGYVCRSTDGGETWTSQFLDTNFSFREVKMYDEKFGVMIGILSNRIFITQDGGLSWLQTTVPDSINKLYNSIDLPNDSTIIITCYRSKRYTIIRSYNRGATWVEYDAFYKINDIKFINDQVGWACGSAGYGTDRYFQYVEKTTNGGKSWTRIYQANMGDYGLSFIDFIDEKNGLAASKSANIISTTDGGNTWVADSFYDYENVKSGLMFTGISFKSINKAFLSGFLDKVYISEGFLTNIIDKYFESESLSLSPNPTTDYITLTPEAAAEAKRIQIFSIEGIKMYDGEYS